MCISSVINDLTTLGILEIAPSLQIIVRTNHLVHFLRISYYKSGLKHGLIMYFSISTHNTYCHCGSLCVQYITLDYQYRYLHNHLFKTLQLFHSPAPYKAVKKNISLSENKVELTCESQGFPLARVTWNNSKLKEPLPEDHIETRHAMNSDGVFVVTSRLSVTRDTNNYTCSYLTDDGKTQTATFRIPGGCL